MITMDLGSTSMNRHLNHTINASIAVGLLLSAQAGMVSGYDHGGSHSYVIIIVVVVVVKVIFWVAVCHACGQR